MYIYIYACIMYIYIYIIILYYIILYYIILYCIILYYIIYIYIFDIICIMCIHISAWHHSSLFPECVVRVPVSLWGSGGWGCVRSTLRLCSQPFATVPNRPQPSVQAPNGRAFGKFCTLGGCTCRVASFRMAGVALRDVQTSFVTRGKLFCVAGIILLRRFQKMRCFFVASAALWTCPWSFCVAGTALYTCRVTCFLRIAMSGPNQVATRCKSVAGVAFCEMWY